MACNYNSWFCLMFFFLLIRIATSTLVISYDVLNVHGHWGRALLQAKKACNISFENLDYTVITSKCKGPKYPAKSCCGALKDFACPYAETLNDRTNNCAETMFSYINLYGKYPPGLFANECREGQQGLDCTNITSSSSSPTLIQSPLLIPTSGILLLGLYNLQLI